MIRAGVALLLLGAALAARAHPDDPPLAHTGGFGEPHCGACHFGALPGGAPVVALDVSDTVHAGAWIDVYVRILHPALRLAGFELSARTVAPCEGCQAGRFRVGEGIRLQLHEGVEYVDGVSSAARWSMRWCAPADPGEVVWSLAINAADGDQSPLGDSAVTLERHVRVVAGAVLPSSATCADGRESANTERSPRLSVPGTEER